MFIPRYGPSVTETSLTIADRALAEEVPPGWVIERGVFGLPTAVRRPTPTSLHVVVARSHRELLTRLWRITGQS